MSETAVQYWSKMILEIQQIRALFTGVPDGSERIWEALQRLADLENCAHQCLNEEITREHK